MDVGIRSHLSCFADDEVKEHKQNEKTAIYRRNFRNQSKS
jgi:hypothetical protein